MGRIGCVRCENAPKQYEMHQNVSLGSNGEDRVLSLRQIPMQLRGTHYCTSSAHFTLSIVRQPNGPECTQIVRNTPKRQFRVQLGGSGAFGSKMHPNSTKRTKMSV